MSITTKIRVTVFPCMHGKQHGIAKKMVVSTQDDFRTFLKNASHKLWKDETQAKRMFDSKGAEVEDCEALREDDDLYVTKGEVFKPTPSHPDAVHFPLAQLHINKKFTVNGGIRTVEEVFYVEPDVKPLLNAIDERSYILLQGPRGVGKTTRCYHAIRTALHTKYSCIFTSFQAGVDASNKDKFWNTFGREVLTSLTALEIHTERRIENARDFMDLFTDHRLFQGKPVVLFVDELDLLLHSNEVSEDFLGSLRAMKAERPTTYFIQSVIGIGPFSVIDLTAQRLSPFNITDVITATRFTSDQVTKLFTQFQQERRVVIPEEVVQDIFQRTAGHAGLVCFCGKKLQESLLLNKPSIDFASWYEYAMTELVDHLPNAWATVGRIYKMLVDNQQARQLLMDHFLHCDVSIKITHPNRLLLAKQLVAEGVLYTEGVESNEFLIPSPLIRAIILRTVIPDRKRPNIFPIYNGHLNVVEVLKFGLPYFDGDRMVRAVSDSYKKNRDTNSVAKRDEQVPCESCYQTELTLLLGSILPTGWVTDTEVNAHNTACDIVVTAAKPDKHKYALELVAHAAPSNETTKTNGSLAEHYVRCQEIYHTNLKTKECWVINFTTKKPDSGYLWPSENIKNVQVIHVWHDLDWKNATVTYKQKDNGEIVSDNVKLR